MKSSRIFLLVLAAGLMVFFGINLSKNLSSYSDFETAKKSGRQVHIPGEWVDRDKAVETDNSFQFYVKDSLNHVEMVHYYDPKPNNFDQAEKVVLIGGYKQEGFVADRIVTKCPSKYNETDAELSGY